MTTIRVHIKLVSLVAWTFLVYGLWVCAWPLGGFSLDRLRPFRRRLLKWWGSGCLAIVGVRLDIGGAPPEPPFLLVSNHLTYLDIMVHARQTGAIFVAHSGMREWPVLGVMFRTTHMLFIRRESRQDAGRVIEQVQEALAKEDGVVVFPEGRCSRGVEVKKFHPALFEPAARGGTPVHFAALSYETPEGSPAAADDVVWWRWESLYDHFCRFAVLPYCTARLRYGTASLPTADRKTLCQQAHQGVSALFIPVEQGVLEELPPPEEAHKLHPYRNAPPPPDSVHTDDERPVRQAP